MKRPFITVVGLFAVVSFWLVVREAGAQRRPVNQSPELLLRVQQLELRVAQLERAAGRRPETSVIDDPRLSVEDAAERLQNAADNLEYSEGVFDRGYISEHELETARFAFARATKQLELAKSVQAGDGAAPRLQRELGILAAEQQLALAERQRQSIKRLADKGLVSRTESQMHERAVNFARQHLDQIRNADPAALEPTPETSPPRLDANHHELPTPPPPAGKGQQ